MLIFGLVNLDDFRYSQLGSNYYLDHNNSNYLSRIGSHIDLAILQAHSKSFEGPWGSETIHHFQDSSFPELPSDSKFIVSPVLEVKLA